MSPTAAMVIGGLGGGGGGGGDRGGGEAVVGEAFAFPKSGEEVCELEFVFSGEFTKSL